MENLQSGGRIFCKSYFNLFLEDSWDQALQNPHFPHLSSSSKRKCHVVCTAAPGPLEMLKQWPRRPGSGTLLKIVLPVSAAIMATANFGLEARKEAQHCMPTREAGKRRLFDFKIKHRLYYPWLLENFEIIVGHFQRLWEKLEYPLLFGTEVVLDGTNVWPNLDFVSFQYRFWLFGFFPQGLCTFVACVKWHNCFA